MTAPSASPARGSSARACFAAFASARRLQVISEFASKTASPRLVCLMVACADCSDGALDHLDVPGNAHVRAVSDGWEVDIPATREREADDGYRRLARGFASGAPKRLTRSQFSPEEWAAIQLHRKFFKAGANEGSRSDGSWDNADREMDSAGFNEGNSQMPVRAARDMGEAWDGGEGGPGSRDRYYHWVTKDGRTDKMGEQYKVFDGPIFDGRKGAEEKGQAKERQESLGAEERERERDSENEFVKGGEQEVMTGDDTKPSWLVVRQSARERTIKVERDARGQVKRIAVPMSAVIEPKGAGSWEITLPKAGSSESKDEAVVQVKDARDPSNAEKIETVAPQWPAVSDPGDLPGEDATVQSAQRARSAMSAGDNDAQLNGQAVDRAAYGIPERAPEGDDLEPLPFRASGKVAARGTHGPWALPSSVRDVPAVGVAAAAYVKSTARGGDAPRRESGDVTAHDMTPKWARKPVTDVYAPNQDPFYCMDGTESSLCGTTGHSEQEHDFSLGWDDGDGSDEREGVDSRRVGVVAKAQSALAREESRDRAGELGELQRRAGYRQTPASGDPYKYIRTGNYASILRHEDQVVAGSPSAPTEAGRTGRVQLSAGEQGKDSKWPGGDPRIVPALPYKVRAPYDGSLVKVGYPNMRGGMRGEDGDLLPYDDRSGAGNNVISHKDWASDVWARPSVFGERDVRDSVNRNEEGGARRLIDERGFHEYEAGNRGFHEPRPDDPHDADDSRESSTLRVDQFDVVGDEEGRRREARGGDGNADEFDSSRPASKADYDEDMGEQHRNREFDGATEHMYMPSGKAASHEAALAADTKRAAELRIAERARRRTQELRWPDGDSDRRRDDSRDLRRAEGSRAWSDSDYQEERRAHDMAERSNREREDEKDFQRRSLSRSHEREAALLRRWSRRAARDSELAATSRTELASRGARLQQLTQEPLSSSAQAGEERVNTIAEAKLKAQVARSTPHSLDSVRARLAEEHVNEVAARKLAAEARLVRLHGAISTASLQSTPASQEGAAGAGKGGAGAGGGAGGGEISHSIHSWLGVYEKHAPTPPRTTLSAGVDAVDAYNKKALAHILSSAHGGDASARLTARQAYLTLKREEHPQQLALKRRYLFVCCTARVAPPPSVTRRSRGLPLLPPV